MSRMGVGSSPKSDRPEIAAGILLVTATTGYGKKGESRV